MMPSTLVWLDYVVMPTFCYYVILFLQAELERVRILCERVSKRERIKVCAKISMFI